MLFDAKIGFVKINIGARCSVSRKLADQKLRFLKEASYYTNTFPTERWGERVDVECSKQLNDI